MNNSFGRNLSVTLFGESHGPFIGAVLDGLAPGIEIDEEYIRKQLKLRRPSGKISTKRVEADEFILASGVFNGKTTGTALCILIPNTAQHSADYTKKGHLYRPGHADYTALCKYHGYEDFRGGGHFSGRVTAALVAAGAIVKLALSKKGIKIGTHMKQVFDVSDRDFEDFDKDIDFINDCEFPVFDMDAAECMRKIAEKAADEGDSVGGILETAVIGMPAGVGEPWFDTVEGILSHALYSIPAIKGVEFGLGFDGTTCFGSEYNDSLYNTGMGIATKTNNNGGINGGITNGMPIVFRLAVKPTPSIYKQQDSINLNTNEDAKLKIAGRHDPAIIHRARIVVDSVTALVIYDLLCGRFGTDFFGPAE